MKLRAKHYNFLMSHVSEHESLRPWMGAFLDTIPAADTMILLLLRGEHGLATMQGDTKETLMRNTIRLGNEGRKEVIRLFAKYGLNYNALSIALKGITDISIYSPQTYYSDIERVDLTGDVFAGLFSPEQLNFLFSVNEIDSDLKNIDLITLDFSKKNTITIDEAIQAFEGEYLDFAALREDDRFTSLLLGSSNQNSQDLRTLLEYQALPAHVFTLDALASSELTTKEEDLLRIILPDIKTSKQFARAATDPRVIDALRELQETIRESIQKPDEPTL